VGCCTEAYGMNLEDLALRWPACFRNPEFSIFLFGVEARPREMQLPVIHSASGEERNSTQWLRLERSPRPRQGVYWVFLTKTESAKKSGVAILVVWRDG
jgi:hypothetical protein